MYVKPLIIYSLFFLMLLFNHNPSVLNNVVPTMGDVETEAKNEIEEINLNLKQEEVAISFLNLSSGESTLIQDHEGNTVLINTGSTESYKHLAQQLDILHIKEIDTLVLTNNSKFYTGNVQSLLKDYKVKQIFLPNQMKLSFDEKFSLESEKLLGFKEGDIRQLFDQLEFRVLKIDTNPDLEEVGTALSIKYGHTKLLFMGVASEEAEDQLTEKYDVKAEILKVGAFGHYFGTSALFLEEVDPQVAIVFKKKGYMPSQDVMERLQEAWIDIYHPFRQGIIMVKMDIESYEVITIPEVSSK